MKMKGKKGQALTFDTAPRTILLFVLIGMILGAGIIALVSFRDTARVPTDLVTGFTSLNGTAVSYAENAQVFSCSGTSILNGSIDVTAQFSLDETACTATLEAAVGFNNTAYNASYVGAVDGDAVTALENSISGGSNLSAQLPTVGTILGVGLILVVVIGVFAFFATRGI